MKIYKIPRFLLAAGLALSLTAPALIAAPSKAVKPAAKSARPGQKQGRIKQIIKQLGLSTAQTSKMEAIWKKAQADLKTLHNNATFTPDQKKARRQVIIADRAANIEKLLTPSQRQKMAAMLTALKKQREAHNKKTGTKPNKKL